MTKNNEHINEWNEEFSIEDNNKRNIYKVPNNYFESLQESIEQKIIEIDLNDLKFSKRNIYEIPDQYFSTMENPVHKPDSDKIIILNRWNNYNVFKIAASVSLIIGIAYLSFLFINNSTNNIDLMSNNYDFKISEYETGLFNESEDELIASLNFEEEIISNNTNLINENDLTIDELDEYLNSDIELSIEF